MSFFNRITRNNPKYGKGTHKIAVDALTLATPDQLIAKVLKRFESPEYKPPRLPKAATEMMALTQQPKVKFRAITRTLEKDELLSSRMLQVAQSPLYTPTSQVRSIRDALVRLGLSTVRNIVFQEALNMRVFRCKGYVEPMTQLNRHNVATAHICRIIGRYTPLDAEQAFMCGLLHDIGIAGILLAFGDLGRGQTPPKLDAVWSNIDDAHESVSATMARLWGLPPIIHQTIGHHHFPFFDGHLHPIAGAVCLAEHIATALGSGVGPATCLDCDTTPKNVIDKVQSGFGLAMKQMDLIYEEAHSALEML